MHQSAQNGGDSNEVGGEKREFKDTGLKARINKGVFAFKKKKPVLSV